MLYSKVRRTCGLHKNLSTLCTLYSCRPGTPARPSGPILYLARLGFWPDPVYGPTRFLAALLCVALQKDPPAPEHNLQFCLQFRTVITPPPCWKPSLEKNWIEVSSSNIFFSSQCQTIYLARKTLEKIQQYFVHRHYTRKLLPESQYNLHLKRCCPSVQLD